MFGGEGAEHDPFGLEGIGSRPIDDAYGTTKLENYESGTIDAFLNITGSEPILVNHSVWYNSIYQPISGGSDPPTSQTSWERDESLLRLLDLRLSTPLVGLTQIYGAGTGPTVGRNNRWRPETTVPTTQEWSSMLSGKISAPLSSQTISNESDSAPLHSSPVIWRIEIFPFAGSYKFDFEENEFLSLLVDGQIYNRLAGGQDPALLFPNTPSGTLLAPIGFAK